MYSKFDRLTSVTALFLALATSFMFLPATLAAASASAVSVPQQTGAILTTAGNRPITVNGASASGGTTIMTGATIETPDQVGAAMSLPGHFSLDIAPRAKVIVEFDRNGIKVNLIQGCVVLHIVKGTTAEIDTSRGVAKKADGSKDDRLDVCDPSIATAPAATAGGLSTGSKVAIVAAIAGAAALIPILTGGSNPSPRTP